MEEMNLFKCCEPRALDFINNLMQWMIWMILGRELKDPDAMDNSELSMTWTI